MGTTCPFGLRFLPDIVQPEKPLRTSENPETWTHGMMGTYVPFSGNPSDGQCTGTRVFETEVHNAIRRLGPETGLLSELLKGTVVFSSQHHMHIYLDNSRSKPGRVLESESADRKTRVFSHLAMLPGRRFIVNVSEGVGKLCIVRYVRGVF